MAQSETAPSPPDGIRWAVTEVCGNKFAIEFECRDAYEAIEFAEVCAAGLAEGELTIEVNNDVEV